MPTAGTFGGGECTHRLDRHTGGGGFDGIDVGDLSVGGIVVEDNQFTPESGVEGFGHTKGKGDSNCGIGGCAALFEDSDSGLGGLRTA